MATQVEIRAVKVVQVNDRGFKSSTGDWLNVSKFADDRDVVLPAVGDHVVVQVDKAGFVRKIETVAPPATPAPASATPEADRSNVGAISSRLEQDDHGSVILRMNVMTTATAILSSGGRPVNPDEVLEMAARLEVWATR